MDNAGAKQYGCDGEGAVATPSVARTNAETVATSGVALMNAETVATPSVALSFPGPRLFGVEAHKGNSLPHWELKCAVYHVCFRLADSIPRHVLQEWQDERQELMRRAYGSDSVMTNDETRRLRYLCSEKIESYLDSGCGACLLRDERVSGAVVEALRHSDGCQYCLLAYGLMPNHVHVMVQLKAAIKLSTVVHAWKSVSGHRINRLLRRHGDLWQSDYYSHIIRSAEEFRHQLDYVYGNDSVASWRYDKDDGAGASAT